MNINKLNLIPLSLASLTILTGTILVSSIVSADDSVIDEINITVPVSCTLSGTGMNTHNAEINNGQYNSAIGETTLKAFCNDNNGFAIYAIGYTDNEDGKNVLTSSTLGSTYDIVTGTAISGDTSNWAMKLSTITSPTPTYPIIIAGSTDDAEKEQGDPDYSAFQEVPDDYALVAKRTAGTDIGTNAEGSTLKSTYQAYISSTQPAGTYTGQVKYTLVHPHEAEAPFACKPSGTTISTIVCMQDISSTNKSTILSSMTEDRQYTLRDKRDGKTYMVSKLKDGNIWMTQNLDLDLDSGKSYTNLDTDLGWNASTNTYDTASWTPANSTYATGDTTWLFSSVVPESYDPGDLYWNGEMNPKWSGSTDFVSDTGSPHYYLGNFYNWTAAIAMNDSSNYINLYDETNQSICPNGWTLPKSGNNASSGSFQYLFEQYGWDTSSAQMTDPTIWDTSIKLIPSGGWMYDGFDRVGNEGIFWSSTVHSSNYAYGGDVSGYYVMPDMWGMSNRGIGYSVRCIVR